MLVGEVARPHGIRGEVAVDTFSDHPGRFAPGAELLVGSPGGGPGDLRPARIVRSRPQPGHPGRLILQLDETVDRTMAEALRGAQLFVPEGAEPAPLEEGAFWEGDLIGLEVRGTDGALLGTLAAVHVRPEQDLWEMTPVAGAAPGAGPTVLIPATAAIVRSVDLAAGVVTIDPPPGLLGD